MPNQNTTSVTVESVKDTDLIVISNDQVLTSSLTVAEYFEKRHDTVLRAIANAESSLRNFAGTDNVVISSTYKDSQGKDRPMYYLNRDAFTFVVMSFTGEKAAAWKWRYIQAFNRMEATLRNQQQSKPVSKLSALKQIVEVLEEQDQRISAVEDTVELQGQTIKRLQQAHNGITLRHEMKNNDQQKQIDQNTEDITSLQKSMFELLQEKGDISQDLDIFIKSLVKTYDRYLMLDNKARYQTAWNDFYKAIADEAGKPNSEGYIMALVNRKREEQIKGGVAKTTAYKNVTGKTVINNYPELKNAAIAVMARITEDIKNHELDKEQEG